MELGNIIEYFENKTILITGVTGFLAKLFIEKILRVQPNVKKLYLLLRAANSASANERFQNEVIGKELFRVAKEKFRGNLNSIISKKIRVIPGDVSYEDLGIKDLSLIKEIKNELDFVLNFAATTNFDERYDVALGTNTLGAKNILCFAKSCPKLSLLVHVSTAYVCGERSGMIDENSYHMGETLADGVPELNIDKEKKLIDKKLFELKAEGATETTIRDVMKGLGIQRAKKYGWPNTYVFTKAMGEMIVQDLKGNMPVVIIRPTMVTSTFKEPFPGWIEGVRTIDALIVGYGKGKLKFFVADLSAIVDLIPADMVINAIIVAMVADGKKHDVNGTYQVGSSLRNPITYSDFKNYCCDYFTNKPYLDKNGKPIKVTTPTILTSIPNFHTFISLRYTPFLKALRLANKISCNQFEGKYTLLDRKIKFVKRLVELYQPYLFFHGIFEDSNVQKLLKKANENGAHMDTFFFDAKAIDWDDYFMNTHIPGIVKYAFKR